MIRSEQSLLGLSGTGRCPLRTLLVPSAGGADHVLQRMWSADRCLAAVLPAMRSPGDSDSDGDAATVDLDARASPRAHVGHSLDCICRLDAADWFVAVGVLSGMFHNWGFPFEHGLRVLQFSVREHAVADSDHHHGSAGARRAVFRHRHRIVATRAVGSIAGARNGVPHPDQADHWEPRSRFIRCGCCCPARQARSTTRSRRPAYNSRMEFPISRMRRLRRNEPLRAIVRETRLDPSALILPLFLCPGEGVRKAARFHARSLQLLDG